MKKSGLLCGLMLLAGMTISGAALADRWGHDHDHGHVSIGFYVGAPYHPYYPYYGPYPYYPYPYYAPPPVVVVPQAPPVYVEQPQSAPPAAQIAPAPQATNSWYHCDNPDGYYPYIKECPGGWKAVAPSPPAQK